MPETEEIVTSEGAQPAPEQPAVPEAATPEEQQESAEEPKPKGGFQRRIDKLTHERYELREQLAEMRGRLAALEQVRAGQPAAETARQEREDPEPDLNTFKTYEEYVKALARWVARQEQKEALTKHEANQRKTETEQRDREVLDSYRERAAEFAAEHDDFDEVVGRMRLSESVANSVTLAMLEDDNGPELAYYLGQHPDIWKRLDQMTPAGAVKYLGRLSERLFPEAMASDEEEEAPEAPAVRPPKPKPAAQAPAPIKPVKKPAPTSTGLSDDLPIEEWMKRRETQRRRQ